MPRLTFSPYRAALAACALAAVLSACAGNGTRQDVRYDLGPLPMPAANAALPPLKVLEVSAPPPLDNDGFVYRLASDPQRASRYADSRWTMSPARLFTLRLRTTLAARVTVLTGGDSVPAPLLKVELDQFEQVFDSATESAGVLSARATLMQGGKVIGQRTFVARAPASTPDAAGGARALATASDDLIGQIAAWLGQQPRALAQ